MGSKRKRSMDDSPLSVCSYTWATPETQSPIPFPHDAMQMHVDACSRHNGWDFSNASRVKSSDWGNRTRKRFRDNRPDDRSIHETTLQKLFSAQRNHPDASPIPSEPLPTQQPTIALSKPVQKSTLHSFWKLPAPPVQTIFPQVHQVERQFPSCDDCESPLQSTDGSLNIDMDTDMGGAVESSPFACCDCGKNVCDTCAVASANRHCLQCATKARNSGRWW